jgi:pantoate--beta-alanine ligase
MIIFKRAAKLTEFLALQREKGIKTGFIPTMGALHAGHISLIETAKKRNDCTICSIFVNPTQFNDPSDFEKYPVTTDKDIAMLIDAGCSVLFLPPLSEIYPRGTGAIPHFELGYLETILEGKYRPGHFQGVCNVVQRLLAIVQPDDLYMGQKDYQQCMVVARLLELEGWSDRIRLNVSPTLREEDGLAMSSRNARLNDEERTRAVAIFRALSQLRKEIHPGKLDPLKEQAAGLLRKEGLRPDYVEIATADKLEIIQDWNGTDELVALAAAYLGEVRLIDNMLLN